IDVFLGTGTDLPSSPDVTIGAPKLVDLAVGDLNGDHLDDLVSTETASSYDVVLRSQIPVLAVLTSPPVLAHHVPPSELSPGDVAFGIYLSVEAPQFSANVVGDLNGDGHDDVAALSADGTLRLYVQQDGGGLGAPCSFPAPDASGDDAATSIGDLTGDGAAEI